MDKGNTGFTHNGINIDGFTCKCCKCGSENVSIEYAFRYYGGATGYDHFLSVDCRECKSSTDIHI